MGSNSLINTKSQTYLSIISFSNFYSWDVKSYSCSTNEFNKFNKLVTFGYFLKKANIQKIKIEDDKVYKILGVRSYGKGVYVNRTVKGKTLKMREYQRAKTNHLFWCKVDTKNGAFGVINDDLADGIASSNMTFAEIDTSRINVEFLQLLFSSKGIMQYLDSYVTGTTNRKYIRPEQLLNDIKIPLPRIEAQNRIVETYRRQILESIEYENQANNLEKHIETYFFEKLGIKDKITTKNPNLLQLVNYADINRWDTQFLLCQIPTFESKYNQVYFSNVLINFNKNNNQTIRIDSSKLPNEEFRYIGMENIEKETGLLLNMPTVKGKDVKSQTLKVPSNFILYGKLRPYLNKYWINKTDFDNIICSSEFFVFDIDPCINKHFFLNILSSKLIQNQIADQTSGARMPRINEETFFNLKFPLPPKNIQDEISSTIENIKDKIHALKADIENIKNEAENEFEMEIFGK